MKQLLARSQNSRTGQRGELRREPAASLEHSAMSLHNAAGLGPHGHSLLDTTPSCLKSSVPLCLTPSKACPGQWKPESSHAKEPCRQEEGLARYGCFNHEAKWELAGSPGHHVSRDAGDSRTSFPAIEGNPLPACPTWASCFVCAHFLPRETSWGTNGPAMSVLLRE